MDMRHMIGAVLLVLAGYWLGRKYPTALQMIPIIGS